MNPLTNEIRVGTIGELLVVLRLLEYDIQACFTLKDTGNDLIAVKDSIVKSIQVKSTLQNHWTSPRSSSKYDVLALVLLVASDGHYNLENSKIYMLSKNEVGERTSINLENIRDYQLNENRIQQLFSTT